MIPLLDKNKIASVEYDIVLVGGVNVPMQDIMREAQRLRLERSKVVLVRMLFIPDFTFERYKKLQRSQLSIVSMGNLGAILANLFGLNSPVVNITASDRDFVNFLRDPWRHLDSAVRSTTNWFNLLVLMYTEDRAVLEEFDRLPYAKKVCFVPFKSDLDSAFFIHPYDVAGRPFEIAVNEVIAGSRICFDMWDMILNGNSTKRQPPFYNNTRVDYDDLVPADGRVHFYNCVVMVREANTNWLTRFINKYVPGNEIFNVFSVHGERKIVSQSKLKRKIFLNYEEVMVRPNFRAYADYCLDCVDLSLGFEFFKNPNYLRLPFWMLTEFEPVIDMTAIENTIAEINAARNTKKYECVLINSHDMWNTRTPIYNLLKGVLDIKCAGKWNRNTDELQTVYNNDKHKYVREFKFNICPENVNRFGYVTEKIFDAFRAGSIPIYYGSDNRPEPGIINPSAVLFFDPNSDNQELVKEVKRLKSDDAYYDKFMRQEKLFAKPAADYIYSTFQELANRLRQL